MGATRTGFLYWFWTMAIDYQVSIHHTLSMTRRSVDTLPPHERGTFFHALLGRESHGYASIRDDPVGAGLFVGWRRLGPANVRSGRTFGALVRVALMTIIGAELVALVNDIGQCR